VVLVWLLWVLVAAEGVWLLRALVVAEGVWLLRALVATEGGVGVVAPIFGGC
jgi:hypothetical protein